MKRRIWIITLFPEYFKGFMEYGVVAQALKGERGESFDVQLISLRSHSPKNYKAVDDAPYGGGPGMVMRADILKDALIQGIAVPGGYALDDLKSQLHVVYASPRGAPWGATACRDFAQRHWGAASSKDLVFICGRYEGIDERFIERYVDEQISLGDYILTGGELAVMVIIDSALRFHPGVLGNKQSSEAESFQGILLEQPQYTRPQNFDGLEVPEVLMSGHHGKISAYQQAERERITKNHRMDLWQAYEAKKNHSEKLAQAATQKSNSERINKNIKKDTKKI